MYRLIVTENAPDGFQIWNVPFSTEADLDTVVRCVCDDILVSPYPDDPAPQYKNNTDSYETIVKKLMDGETVRLGTIDIDKSEYYWYFKVKNSNN